jgi:hypothetical protein
LTSKPTSCRITPRKKKTPLLILTAIYEGFGEKPRFETQLCHDNNLAIIVIKNLICDEVLYNKGLYDHIRGTTLTFSVPQIEKLREAWHDDDVYGLLETWNKSNGVCKFTLRYGGDDMVDEHPAFPFGEKE